jgi:hypothetical protein
MVKALGGVAVLLTATAVLAVALGGNPFHNSAPPSRTARELAAAARAQCGGKQAIPACVRLVSEKIRFDHRRSVRTQCGGRQAEPACIRLIGQGIGAHS